MKIRTITLTLLLFTIVNTITAQIFYKVEGNNLTAPSYILGTHHLAPLSILDSIPSWKEAYADCSQVVGELDMTVDKMALSIKMQPYMMAPQDSTLTTVIEKKDFDRINKEFKKWAPMPGMDLNMLNVMRPMAITSMITVKMIQDNFPEFNPNEQLDLYFQEKAKADGKKIVGLETPEFQAEVLFCTTPISEQAKALIDVLDNPQKNVENAKKLNTYYMERNLDALYEMSKEDEMSDGKFMEVLLYKRNSEWLKTLPSIIQEKSSFIVVGALHLAGDKGIVKGLQDAGYSVTPISK